MKTCIRLLQIYILSVSCSPSLDYSMNSAQKVLVDSNSSEEGNLGTIGGMRVLYPEDTYSVPNSVYSDTTVGKINGVVVEIFKGANGEIVVQIPNGLRNGEMTIELSNSDESLTIDNVFHLNDPSIPLFSGSSSFICSGTQFYNASGILTTGTKNCSGPADCVADGEVGCITNASAPAALTENLNPGDIRNGRTIGGVVGSYSGSGRRPDCDGSRVDDCTANPSFPAMELSGAAAKILSTESLGGQLGNVVLPDANKVRSGINFGVLGGVTGTYEGPPLPPSNLLSTDVSSTQINISWNSEANATSYLLIANEDFPVTFVPTDGETYGISSQIGGSIIYVGSATSHNQTTGVSADNTYHYALYSYDGADYSVVASKSTANTFCSDLAGEWVRVPGDPNYGTKDFCVMKYEAKCSNSDGKACPSEDTPASIAGGEPWVNISQIDAITACSRITDAALISNEQWMTLATNIAGEPINWSSGSVGEGP